MVLHSTTPRRPGRSWSSWLRPCAVAFIVVGPLAVTAWRIHGPERLTLGYTPVETPPEYAAQRLAAIDRLLPDGAGGTRFYESLERDGERSPTLGMAFTARAAIGLSATARLGVWIGEVELHERAHLLDAYQSALVAEFMRRIPRPAPGTLAASEPGQHFAEMAAQAWPFVASLVTVPDIRLQICVEPLDVAALRHAETRVPGTAGFVSRYIDVLSESEPTIARAETLRQASLELSARYRETLASIWHIIDQRRQTDGTLKPWPKPTVSATLAGVRADMARSDHWIDTIAAAVYAPAHLLSKLLRL